MDERPSWEADPLAQTGGEQSTPDGAAPLRDDTPTIPGLPWQHAPFDDGSDYNTPPALVEPGRSAVQPEWPLAQAGNRSTQGSGYCFSIALVGMVGVALVLALVAGTLFAVHTLGSSTPTEENGVTASASQTAQAPTVTARPAQASPTAAPMATVMPTTTSKHADAITAAVERQPTAGDRNVPGWALW